MRHAFAAFRLRLQAARRGAASEVASIAILNVKDDSRHKPDGRGGQNTAHVRQILTAFLGDQADLDEVRAMLRGWINDVRSKNMPPEQALVEFKALLPMGSPRGDGRGDGPSTRNPAELISIFIQEYYAEGQASDGDA